MSPKAQPPRPNTVMATAAAAAAASRVPRGERTRSGPRASSLSIVEAIADAHQAGITARPRPDGGLIVEVAFPLRRLAAPVAHDHADAATLG